MDLAGPLPLSDLWRVYTRSPLAQWSPLLSKSCWTACTREEETVATEDGEFANSAHFSFISAAIGKWRFLKSRKMTPAIAVF